MIRLAATTHVTSMELVMGKPRGGPFRQDSCGARCPRTAAGPLPKRPGLAARALWGTDLPTPRWNPGLRPAQNWRLAPSRPEIGSVVLVAFSVITWTSDPIASIADRVPARGVEG